MKKHITLLIACLVFAGNLFAQQHLSFKGVPINGTLQEYTNAMVKAGFDCEGSQGGVSILSGDFAGYKGCSVRVSTLKNCDVVSFITVTFRGSMVWSSVLNDYNTLKAMLTEKYGKPSDTKENLPAVANPDYDNFIVMRELGEGKYSWCSIFSSELGDIVLSIVNHDGMSVRLAYHDKANSEKVRNAAMDDL